MRCFQIFDRVVNGIEISREARGPQSPDPWIATPPGCPLQLALAEELQSFVATLPPGSVRLSRAGVTFGKTSLVLCRASGRQETQALVHIQTAAGVGGKVFLTANAFDEDLQRGRVSRKFRPFPSAGIQPLCDDTTMEAIQQGVPEYGLNLLAIMNPGASFRSYRTGDLSGAPTQMFVHWTGRELRATNYRERAASFGTETGAT